MNRKPGRWRIATCAVGLLAQLAGFGCLFRPGISEVNLMLALLFYLPGTVAVLDALECWAEKKGVAGAWSLTALLGPVGLLVMALLKAAPQPERSAPEVAPRPRTRRDRAAAVLLVGVVAAGLVWTAWEWWNRAQWPPVITAKSMIAAERKVYGRLQEIQAAEERYKQQDWDHDGRKTYAAYLIHLWQSVDRQGRIIPVHILPRRMAYAMGEEFSLDGYFFRSLTLRDPPPGEPESSSSTLRKLDPEKEWALAAAPMSPSQTGLFSFFTDQSGKIFANSGTWGGLLHSIPCDLAAAGWVEIKSEEDLARLQSTMSYNDHKILETPQLHLRNRH